MCEKRAPRPHQTTPAIYTQEDFDFIDAGIRNEVIILANNGVETFESCEGGPGHTFPEPTIRFFGGPSQGLRVLSIALENGLRPAALRRYYSIIGGEPHGPNWEITFTKPELPDFYSWSKGS